MLRNMGIVLVDDLADAGDSSRSNSIEVADRRLGGKRLLEWSIRRLTDALLVEGVIVVLPETEQGRSLARLVPLDVPVHFHNEVDPLSVVASALRAYPSESVVVATSSCPFLDPALVDQLISSVEAEPNCDFASYCTDEGSSLRLSQIGMVPQWCKSSALRRAEEEATATERDEIGRYMTTHPEQFELCLIPLPSALDRDDVRLTICDEDDWEHAEVILDTLTLDQLDWQGITHLLEDQPALRERMADLNRREVEA